MFSFIAVVKHAVIVVAVLCIFVVIVLAASDGDSTTVSSSKTMSFKTGNDKTWFAHLREFGDAIRFEDLRPSHLQHTNFAFVELPDFDAFRTDPPRVKNRHEAEIRMEETVAWARKFERNLVHAVQKFIDDDKQELYPEGTFAALPWQDIDGDGDGDGMETKIRGTSLSIVRNPIFGSADGGDWTPVNFNAAEFLHFDEAPAKTYRHSNGQLYEVVDFLNFWTALDTITELPLVLIDMSAESMSGIQPSFSSNAVFAPEEARETTILNAVWKPLMKRRESLVFRQHLVPHTATSNLGKKVRGNSRFSVDSRVLLLRRIDGEKKDTH